MATHEEVIERWMIEAGREKASFLHRSTNIFVTKSSPGGVMYYDRQGRGQWGRGTPARNIQLARYVGDRYNGGVCLLNGDGFEDPEATNWQTRVRTAAQRTFGWERCAIIPYQALNGAQIDYDTIRIIEVTQDTQDTRQQPINIPFDMYPHPAKLESMAFHRTDRYKDDPDYHTQVWEGRIQGILCRIEVRNMPAHGSNVDNYTIDTTWAIRSVQVWAQPEFGAHGWQAAGRNGYNYATPQSTNPRTGLAYPQWQWTERVHRLGSVVFSAHGPDARRHRWISAFDMQEPGGLYFLAQCPDKGDCKTFQQALDLLAPPIVHQARQNGRRVYRQGDVFAVEISWPDEQVYDGALMRVRREVVLQDYNNVLLSGRAPLPPADEEVQEKGTCPFCESEHKGFGNGTKARRALMIHGTGHTADEVVVKKNGTTYIRGSMYHDPHLETTGRNPDHTPIRLEHSDAGVGWFVAVRNTVPRSRTRGNQTAPARDTAQMQQLIAAQPTF